MNDFENDPDEFDIESFRDAVRPHWFYHQRCNLMNWNVFKREDEVTQIQIAAPFQIICAASIDDGKKVWSPFEFDVFGFLGEEGIDEIEKVGVVTFSVQDNHGPFIAIVGSYRGKPFALRIHLEPDPATKPLEVIDRIKNEVRPIEEEAY